MKSSWRAGRTRRLTGRDIIWWALETGFLDGTIESLPTPAARLTANLVTTEHGGGHDLHLRTLKALGVVPTGHFLGATYLDRNSSLVRRLYDGA